MACDIPPSPDPVTATLPAYAPMLQLLLHARGGMWFKVTGRSMLPTLRHGDLVKVGFRKQIRIGDIVAYVWHGRLVIHRAVRKRATRQGPRFLIKGDREKRFDEVGWLDRRATVGCVEEVRRGISVQKQAGPWARMRDVAIAMCSSIVGSLYTRHTLPPGGNTERIG